MTEPDRTILSKFNLLGISSDRGVVAEVVKGIIKTKDSCSRQFAIRISPVSRTHDHSCLGSPRLDRVWKTLHILNSENDRDGPNPQMARSPSAKLAAAGTAKRAQLPL